MSDIEDEMLEKAWELFRETSEERSYNSRDIWEVEQLGEHLFQYNTGYKYKDGSTEGNECHVVWYENGKLTSLKTVGLHNGYLHNGYAVGPGGPLYEDMGNGIYESFEPVRRPLGYGKYELSVVGTGLVHISPKGIEEIKSDLSNLSEEDFLRLYRELADRYKYKDALKKRTFDVTGKWGNSAELWPQRLEKHSELVHGGYAYHYIWLMQSSGETIALINNASKGVEVDENRLSDLKGLIKDIQRDEYSVGAKLAAQAYDYSLLSGLLKVVVEAPNTPAFDLISARYREQYGDEIVNGITEYADEIIELPSAYRDVFFDTIKKANSANSNVPEANFLYAFIEKIRGLAMKKYGQEDWSTSISEAAKNPEFMKECDKVWEELFAEADKYATYKQNEYHYKYIRDKNAYIRQMFPEKVEQLHDFVTTEKTGNFREVLDEIIKYHQNVGKMKATISECCKDSVYCSGDWWPFQLVDAGIKTKKEVKRFLDILQLAEEWPNYYDSLNSDYSIHQIAKIAKSDVMQDWMYPVMMDAIEKGGLTMSEGRIPNERTLFDCCKTWKINPAMPQRLAKFVGTHSLKGRMLAGAIFDKMCEEGKTTPQEWRDNKVLHEKFYKELARAEKMPREKAFQQYIPNTPVNRKRVVGMGMEEKGIENTPENFKALYYQMREQGMFEKMLAKPEEAKTTFSARLLVETARRKFDKSR